MEGLRIACLYSYGCQQTKRKKVDKYLLSFFEEQRAKKRKQVFIIKILEDLAPYKTYCQIRGLKEQENPFEESVVRAYWLGDNIGLEPVNLTHNFETLEQFKSIKTKEHLPDWIKEEMLDCLVSSGKVLEVSQKKAKVSNHRLSYQDGRVIFQTRTREIDSSFIANLEKEDLISIHLAIAREKISQEQTENLKRATFKALKYFRGSQNRMIE